MFFCQQCNALNSDERRDEEKKVYVCRICGAEMVEIPDVPTKGGKGSPKAVKMPKGEKAPKVATPSGKVPKSPKSPKNPPVQGLGVEAPEDMEGPAVPRSVAAPPMATAPDKPTVNPLMLVGVLLVGIVLGIAIGVLVL